MRKSFIFLGCLFAVSAVAQAQTTPQVASPQVVAPQTTIADPSPAQRAAQAGQQAFPDVPPTHWAFAAVQKLAAAGVLEGYPAQPKPLPAAVAVAAPSPTRVAKAPLANTASSSVRSGATTAKAQRSTTPAR